MLFNADFSQRVQMDIMKSFQTVYIKWDISLKNMFLNNLRGREILRMPIGLRKG